MVVNTYVLTIGKSSLLQTLKKNSSTFPNSQLETVWLVFDTVKSFGLLLHFFFIRSVVLEVKVNLSKIAFCFCLLSVEFIILALESYFKNLIQCNCVAVLTSGYFSFNLIL